MEAQSDKNAHTGKQDELHSYRKLHKYKWDVTKKSKYTNALMLM